ncbi:MAG: hypothetical protein ACREBU_08260 [Nitrososphaera sp.]
MAYFGQAVLGLPEVAPFALAQDLAIILAFNRTASPDTFVHLVLLPEPFLGNPFAPVVVLGLNPGFSPEDAIHHETDHFVALSRQNLRHASGQYPFYLLNPSLTAPGRTWWEKKLSRLIKAKGREAVAQRLLCVEYFPYHSRRFAHAKLSVPSQDYSVRLVRNALDRDAVIVVLRGEKFWREAVPELATYKQLHRIKNAQNVIITPNNCPEGYDSILAGL